ncbi:uncharacterized protein LOC133290508 [Gastrolobium bilobum]|uniref:uncharacterized protein LOC133290508 n=1 Tax=Gastrolobium bilobum TaxID=150636 RepID=UPI002AB27C2B|nr:uncharacterized protein LOC133290508 [Gastrolobium bilobum]
MRVQDLVEEFSAFQQKVDARLNDNHSQLLRVETRLDDYQNQMALIVTQLQQLYNIVLAIDTCSSDPHRRNPHFDATSSLNTLHGESSDVRNLSKISEEFKVPLAGLRMEGIAAAWYQWMYNSGLIRSWNDLTQGYLFIVDRWVLELIDLSLVLGMPWLEKLERVTHDYMSRSMEFCWNGQKVILEGSVNLAEQNLMIEEEETEAVTCFAFIQNRDESIKAPAPELLALKKVVYDIIWQVLLQYQAVFQSPYELPTFRGLDHEIHLVEGSKPVNKSKIIKDRFPIPTIDELLDELGGAKVFSKLDLRAGYHQIRVLPQDVPKTTFRTYEGHYEFLVMPFGSTNAPATFQAAMNHLFRPYLRRFIIVFFDDILVFSRTIDEHVEHLKIALGNLQLDKFLGKLFKCSFDTTSIDYLGHVVSGEGVHADPKKIKAMVDWHTPYNMKQLRGFLVLTGYYRSGIGAMLLQHERPLAFFSKKLDIRMENALVYVRELYAIAAAVGRNNLVADALSRGYEEGGLNVMVSQPIFSILEEVKRQNSKDPYLLQHHQKWLTNPGADKNLSVKDGILFHNNRRDVKEFVSKCGVCQQVKYEASKPGGLLQPLPIPEGIFEDLTMDFIVGLPPSNGYTTILVIVDRLSKFAYFSKLPRSFTAAVVAKLFCELVVHVHGFPRSIGSNRDPIFVSQFWSQLFKLSGTTLHTSTAYHPQSDEQTEVTNRYLEQYLRCFCNKKPQSWSAFIRWAQFHYNSSVHSSIGMSSHQVVFGKCPILIPHYPRGLVKVEAVDSLLVQRDEILSRLKMHM